MTDIVEQPAEGDAPDTVEAAPDEGRGAEGEQKLADAEARADKYARALFEARVAATGRLADPTDVPFNADLVDDPGALNEAINALLAAKPHLANRKPAWGDVGAGQATPSSGGPTFADLFRSG
ncbi:hypothetical protein [Mycolicibacterium palauense]|uniref:hypothetical protein n=1 Tax=Mycolicibacterium palauense TaxID=2034511 RepID=UPI000BFED190|nr:hypothetical protein [Mycolicibacterium palauense]